MQVFQKVLKGISVLPKHPSLLLPLLVSFIFLSLRTYTETYTQGLSLTSVDSIMHETLEREEDPDMNVYNRLVRQPLPSHYCNCAISNVKVRVGARDYMNDDKGGGKQQTSSQEDQNQQPLLG